MWPNFRIGPKAGQPYPDTQFPVTALDELSKQGVPDVSFGGIPTPVLVVFGDYRDTPTGISTLPTWQTRYEGCQALIGRLKAAGGEAQMISPPEIGSRGNSHMIMQDRNHLQVADLILKWMDERVGKRPAGEKPGK